MYDCGISWPYSFTILFDGVFHDNRFLEILYKLPFFIKYIYFRSVDFNFLLIYNTFNVNYTNLQP